MGTFLSLTSSHLSDVFRVAQESFETPWKESEYLYFLEHRAAFCFGWFVNENLVSYFLSLNVFGDADIISIATAKSHRHQGHAYQLLQKVIAFQKPIRFFLEVNVENMAAISLYKKVGFQEVGIRKKYYDNKFDALQMRLEVVS